MAEHLTNLKGNHRGDYTIYYQKGDKIEKLSDCDIYVLDNVGVTFKDKSKLGKDRRRFIPSFKIVMIEQEFL